MQRGRRSRAAKGCTKVDFGEYGLEGDGRRVVTARQIGADARRETRRQDLTGCSRTNRSRKSRRKSGWEKAKRPEEWVAVASGRVMFELEGISEPLAREAVRLAGHKLPIATKFVARV